MTLGLALFLATAVALLAFRMGFPRLLLPPEKVELQGTAPLPVIPLVVSLVVLSAALYIILSRKYASDSENWAFATAGTIVGFWLKP